MKKETNTEMHAFQENTNAPAVQTIAPAYTPERVFEIELGEPVPTLSTLAEKMGYRYQRVRCLVRLHTYPLGIVEFPLVEDETNPYEYIQHIWHTLGVQIDDHLQQDGLLPVTMPGPEGLSSSSTPRCMKERQQFLSYAPFVSVVVATHNRPRVIQYCLDSLLALHYPHYEIIVVDNAPDSSTTADVIRQIYGDVPQVHYVREDRPGASWARNRGIATARGEILAFTDDDVVVDPYWLIELVRAFRLTDNVACVTGLLLPLELETPAQSWIEEFGGFSKGFRRRTFDMMENHPQTPLHPYTAGQFGTGASMAFTAAFLRSVNGFDPALGPGSLACGGEDLTLFFQAVTQGYKLVYEPASVAYHPHYRKYAELRKQIYSYGVGLTAYLMKNLLD